jgi:hypothetical protein
MMLGVGGHRQAGTGAQVARGKGQEAGRGLQTQGLTHTLTQKRPESVRRKPVRHGTEPGPRRARAALLPGAPPALPAALTATASTATSEVSANETPPAPR